MHRSSTKWRLFGQILFALLAMGLMWSVAAPSHAAEAVTVTAAKDDAGDSGTWGDGGGNGDPLPGGPADNGKKEKAEAAGRKAVESKLCGGLEEKIKLPGVKDVAKNKCKEVVKAKFTLAWVMDADENQVCDAIGKEMPGVAADVFSPACTTALKAAKVGIDWIQKTFKAAYDKVMKAAKKVKDAVDFIKDPKNAFEQVLNDWVKESGKFVRQAVNHAIDTTGFDGSEKWWRDAYAATAGIGLLLLIGLWLKTWSDSAHGLLEPGEMGTALMPWGLLAVIVMSFGPPILYVFGLVSNGFVKGILSWMGGDLTSLVNTINALILPMTSADMPGGSLMGFVLALLMLLAGLSSLLFFGIQYVASYMGGALAGTAVAGFGHPNWRRKAGTALALIIAILAARPAYLLVLGIFAKMNNAWLSSIDTSSAWADDPIGALWRLIVVLVGMVIMCISPAVVLKFFPLLPDAGSVGSGAVVSGGSAGALAGAGVSGANSMMMQRRMSANQQSGGQSVSSGGGESSSGNPSSSSAPAQKPTGSGGKQAAAATGKVGGSAPSTGAAGAAGSAGKAGSAAAGGGSASTGTAAAGAGAGTAGVGAAAIMAADMGVKGAQSAHGKAKAAADSAAPDLETQGSV